MSASIVYRAQAKVMLSRLPDGEAVLLHLEKGIYFGLNETALQIWDGLVERPRSVSELVSLLVDLKKITKARAEADVLDLLRELVDHELVLSDL